MDNTDDDSSELEKDDNTGLKPLVEVKEDVKGNLSELLAEEDMDNDSSALISSEKKRQLQMAYTLLCSSCIGRNVCCSSFISCGWWQGR